MTLDDLYNLYKNLEGIVRRHKHLGQAIDQTEKLNTGTEPSLSPSPSGSAGSGWELVAHETASANEVTITGLDLATDLQYQIIIQCRQDIDQGQLWARMNNESTANHYWIQNYAVIAGSPTNGVDTGLGTNQFQLGQLAASHKSVLYLSHMGGAKTATWQTTSMGNPVFIDSLTVINGGGYYDGANVTSIKFLFSVASQCEWDIWVYKA